MLNFDGYRINESLSSFDRLGRDFFEDLETVFGFSDETSGCIPKSSVALATASDTAMGSVQPSAGTTSRRIKEIIFSLVALSIMLGLLVEWIMMTHTLAVFD